MQVEDLTVSQPEIVRNQLIPVHQSNQNQDERVFEKPHKSILSTPKEKSSTANKSSTNNITTSSVSINGGTTGASVRKRVRIDHTSPSRPSLIPSTTNTKTLLDDFPTHTSTATLLPSASPTSTTTISAHTIIPSSATNFTRNTNSTVSAHNEFLTNWKNQYSILENSYQQQRKDHFTQLLLHQEQIIETLIQENRALKQSFAATPTTSTSTSSIDTTSAELVRLGSENSSLKTSLQKKTDQYRAVKQQYERLKKTLEDARASKAKLDRPNQNQQQGENGNCSESRLANINGESKTEYNDMPNLSPPDNDYTATAATNTTNANNNIITHTSTDAAPTTTTERAKTNIRPRASTTFNTTDRIFSLTSDLLFQTTSSFPVHRSQSLLLTTNSATSNETKPSTPISSTSPHMNTSDTDSTALSFKRHKSLLTDPSKISSNGKSTGCSETSAWKDKFSKKISANTVTTATTSASTLTPRATTNNTTSDSDTSSSSPRLPLQDRTSDVKNQTSTDFHYLISSSVHAAQQKRFANKNNTSTASNNSSNNPQISLFNPRKPPSPATTNFIVSVCPTKFSCTTTTTVATSPRTSPVAPYVSSERRSSVRETFSAAACSDCKKFHQANPHAQDFTECMHINNSSASGKNNSSNSSSEHSNESVRSKIDLLAHAGRHRTEFAPPNTPDQYWLLSQNINQVKSYDANEDAELTQNQHVLNNNHAVERATAAESIDLAHFTDAPVYLNGHNSSQNSENTHDSDIQIISQ